MITVGDFDLTTHPLTMAPRPLPRHSDSWTLVLVSWLVWSLQLQTADCCHIFWSCLLSTDHYMSLPNAATQALQCALTQQYAWCLKADILHNLGFKRKTFSPCLLWVMFIFLFFKASSPLLLSPPSSTFTCPFTPAVVCTKTDFQSVNHHVLPADGRISFAEHRGPISRVIPRV